MKKLLCLALAAMLCLALAACAVAEGNWKIAILTGTTSQGEEEFRAAERAHVAGLAAAGRIKDRPVKHDLPARGGVLLRLDRAARKHRRRAFGLILVSIIQFLSHGSDSL